VATISRREIIHRPPGCARAAQQCCAAQAAGAILTTSEAETDVVKCFELQANSYLLKSMDLSAFEVLVKSVNDFWLTKSRLPQQMRM
jgi:DNA-binding NarL/FixJ family response regulator